MCACVSDCVCECVRLRVWGGRFTMDVTMTVLCRTNKLITGVQISVSVDTLTVCHVVSSSTDHTITDLSSVAGVNCQR